MILDNLYSYIDENATFQSVSRATSYLPKLIDRTYGEFIFECLGSSYNSYRISININDGIKISSNCSCPYEGEGICKHQIASINTIIEMLKTKEIEEEQLIKTITKSATKSKPESITTYIPNKKGIIDIDKLNRLQFNSKPFYFSPIIFKTVQRKRLTATYNDFRSPLLISLEYSPKAEELALDCTCQSTGNCYHKYIFLQSVMENFGFEYFSPDFKNIVQNKVLKEKKLERIVSFDDIFELDISEEGVNVIQKVPNIITSNSSPIKLINRNRKDLFIPKKTEKKEFYDAGLCLEKQDNEITDISPFYGKLNKSKTEISTKLRPIGEIDFTEAIELIDNEEATNFITKSLQLNSAYHDTFYSGINAENIQKISTQFSLLKDDLENRPIFLYDPRKSFVRKNVKVLDLSTEPIIPVVKITEKNPFFQIDFKVKINNTSYKIDSKMVWVTPIGIIFKDTLFPVFNSEVILNLLEAQEKKQINIINTGLKDLRKNVIDPLSSVFEIEFSGIKESKSKVKAKKFEKHIYLSDEEGEYVILQPLMKYGEELVTPCSTEKVWANKEKLSFIKRDEEAEKTFLAFIQELHPRFKNQSNYFYVSTEEALDSMWLMDAIDTLKDEEIRVFGLNELKSIKYNLNKPSFSIGLSSGTDWFDMNIDVQFGDQKVDLKQLQKSIVKKSNYVELKDGTIGILPKQWIEKYKKYFKLGQVKKDKIEISNFQFNIIDELYEDLTNTPKFLEELHEKKKRLSNLKDLKPIPKPKNLKATLRPYQKEGLNWMVFLHENKLGGCLADDMGLGKTIQTIAFLQYLKNNTEEKSTNPHLIIAPTSLMFNWLSEFEKFAPKLKILQFTGSNREELKDQLDKHDVVLTTYGSMIKDIEFHKEKLYNYVILDESQAIKNPQSQRFKAVRLLNCNNRIALTGTPIENNTFDLYSQFNFLNPGIFGSVKHFKATFSDAIDKDRDEYTSDLLARMISPFLLRRTKDQVATELPSKTEALIYCEMGANQRKVYDHFKLYFRQKLLEQIENEGVKKSQMYILQGLTKLRQICNSTALADKEKDFGSDSSKLDELVRHLNEKVNNHKVLVFSQFVGMLHIVRERLNQEGIIYEYLDGQTRNREEKVNNFQNNADIRVFLISLKAGGTGLNLTEADYVYLIDPWWNPAVESQAIDRCYRIGQDKKVMAYRMICKDTIEEKIVQLQDKKKTVAADVIRVDKEKKTFNKKDVELFFGGN